MQAIYSHFVLHTEVVDITVEDPSEDFQRIRDYVDAKNCETLPAYQPAKLLQGWVFIYHYIFTKFYRVESWFLPWILRSHTRSPFQPLYLLIKTLLEQSCYSCILQNVA